jgi:putative component of membrane protein insertase Oxa1/YidC/SpoIIIJ protein YidD
MLAVRILVLEIVALLLAISTGVFFYWLGVFLSLRPALVWLFEGSSLLVLGLTARRTLIIAIELYQHYAPDEVRRRCMLMPSCSEYAILALKKYGTATAIRKTCMRLSKRCKGYYEVDYP